MKNYVARKYVILLLNVIVALKWMDIFLRKNFGNQSRGHQPGANLMFSYELKIAWDRQGREEGAALCRLSIIDIIENQNQCYLSSVCYHSQDNISVSFNW